MVLKRLDPVPVRRKTPLARVQFNTQWACIVLKIAIVPAGTPLQLWHAAIAFMQVRPTMPEVAATALRIGALLASPPPVRVNDEELEDSCC